MEQIEAIKNAQDQLVTMLEESGVTEDDIVAEFNTLRKEHKKEK
mgnify:FL=1